MVGTPDRPPNQPNPPKRHHPTKPRRRALDAFPVPRSAALMGCVWRNWGGFCEGGAEKPEKKRAAMRADGVGGGYISDKFHLLKTSRFYEKR